MQEGAVVSGLRFFQNTSLHFHVVGWSSDCDLFFNYAQQVFIRVFIQVCIRAGTGNAEECHIVLLALINGCGWRSRHGGAGLEFKSLADKFPSVADCWGIILFLMDAIFKNSICGFLNINTLIHNGYYDIVYASINLIEFERGN